MVCKIKHTHSWTSTLRMNCKSTNCETDKSIGGHIWGDKIPLLFIDVIKRQRRQEWKFSGNLHRSLEVISLRRWRHSRSRRLGIRVGTRRTSKRRRRHGHPKLRRTVWGQRVRQGCSCDRRAGRWAVLNNLMNEPVFHQRGRRLRWCRFKKRTSGDVCFHGARRSKRNSAAVSRNGSRVNIFIWSYCRARSTVTSDCDEGRLLDG